MKLAVLSLRHAPGGVAGGAETLLRELARCAVAAGHEVHLLTTCATDHHTWQNRRPPGTETVDGMRVHSFRVDEDRDTASFYRIQSKLDRRQDLGEREEALWLRNGVNSRDLIAWLEREADSFDRILAGPYLFALVIAATKVRPDKTWLVPCLHDEPFARLSCVREMFRRVRGLLFNADPERDLARRLYELPAEKGAVVGMGIAAFEADPGAFAKRHGIEHPYVLYCGRREDGKNTPLLLDYVDAYRKRRQSELRLVLTGSGAYHPPDSLRPAVLDFGYVSEAEKREAMAGAQVFIHPSTNESFGIVLLEAWMAGTPALVHAKSEVLRWQCGQADAGLWFQYYPEFEAMMDLLLGNAPLRRQLGENGRRRVKSLYSPEAVAHRFFNALKDESYAPNP